MLSGTYEPLAGDSGAFLAGSGKFETQPSSTSFLTAMSFGEGVCGEPVGLRIQGRDFLVIGVFADFKPSSCCGVNVRHVASLDRVDVLFGLFFRG